MVMIFKNSKYFKQNQKRVSLNNFTNLKIKLRLYTQ